MARIEKWDEVHGTQAPDERMMAFLDSTTDQYAILQLRRSEDTVYERFSSMRELERMGLEPDIDHYEVVYTAPLLPYKDQNTMLEELYAKFNVSRPDDFTGHSLSVSDIVALRQNGVVSCHYVDSIGFQELPGFLKPENYLKAAEMAMEDDYGMIDGIINNGAKEPTVAELEQQARSGQPISLMDLADAVHREEREKKKSVMEQLKSQPKTEHKKTAPKKSAEREI